MRTFSKLYGLAALRLGWLTAAAGIVDVMNRVRGPFNVSQPAQAAGVAALDDEEHAANARASTTAAGCLGSARELADLGLHVHPSLGNFVLVEFPRGAGRDAAAANACLEAEGMIPRQMDAYGLPHCLRISVGLEEENRRLVEALADFVDGRAAGMTPFDRVAMLGIGLINGSLALCCAGRVRPTRSSAYARQERTRARAVELGLCDRAEADPAAAVAGADLVVLGVPPAAVGAVAAAMRPGLAAEAIVTDVSSIKAQIVRDVVPHLPTPACSCPAIRSPAPSIPARTPPSPPCSSAAAAS